MFFKKSIKKFKEDLKQDKENLTEFYSNPKKYLKKTHPFVLFVTFLYVVGFLIIIKFTPESSENILYKFAYILSGYFLLVFLHEKLKNK